MDIFIRNNRTGKKCGKFLKERKILIHLKIQFDSVKKYDQIMLK